jgi:predicted transcriptional regulator of viral defense system
MLKVYEKLLGLEKRYFTGRELAGLLAITSQSRGVVLSRLVRRQILRRLRRDLYEVVIRPSDILEAANIIYQPSYLSFAYCLGKLGITDQIAYEIEFATPRKTKRMKMNERNIVFRKISRKLFFGYALKDNVFIAEPEKALLDTLYLKSRGLAELNEAALDLSDLSRDKLLKMSSSFPVNVQAAVKRLMRRMKG